MAWGDNRYGGWGNNWTTHPRIGTNSGRWNETCTLVGKTYKVDDEGVPQPTDSKTEVFCNPRTVGAHTWSSMYEIGISVDAQLQIRSCDYGGQRDVFYRDKWYSVETVQEQGDFCTLTLRHQKSDSDDSEGADDGV